MSLRRLGCQQGAAGKGCAVNAAGLCRRAGNAQHPSAPGNGSSRTGQTGTNCIQLQLPCAIWVRMCKSLLPAAAASPAHPAPALPSLGMTEGWATGAWAGRSPWPSRTFPSLIVTAGLRHGILGFRNNS